MIMMTGCMTHRKGLLLTPMGHAGQSAGGFGGLGVRIFFWGGGAPEDATVGPACSPHMGGGRAAAY